MKKTLLGMIAASACAALCGLTLIACNDTPNGGTPPSDQTVHTHDYVPEVVAPQCAAEGYTRYKCSCGAEYREGFVEALGHSMSGDVCSRCSAHPSEGLEYVSVAGGYEVKGIGSFAGKDLIIPSIYNGGSVVSVGERAFLYQKNLEYVTLPATIKKIGKQAFYDCESLKAIQMPAVEELGDLCLCAENLKKIELPDTLKVIGASVFSKLKMDSLHVPASVEEIGARAFSGCELGSITVAEGNAHYKSVDNCVIGPVTDHEGTRTVLLFGCKNSRIPNDGSFSEIYDAAFSGVVGLDELVIPDSIEKIGSGVFSDSDMRSLKIGKGLNTIRYGAFFHCENLTKITVDPENETFAAAGNCIINKAKKAVVLGCKTSVIPADPNVVTEIAARAFYECPIPESFVIPANVTKIGGYAFGYSGLKNVTIRGNLTEATSAFASATSLKNVTFEEGVTKIAKNMFSNSSVETVQLPSSLTEIGEGAFASSSLVSVEIPEKVTVIPESAFSDCSVLTQFVVPDNITGIGANAFANCYNLVKLTLGANVAEIGLQAFNNCYRLTELVNLSALNIQKTSTKDTEFGNLGYSVKNTQFNRNPCFFEGEIYTSSDYESKLDFVDGFVFYNNAGNWELYACGVIGDVTLPTGYKGASYDVATGAFVNSHVTGITVKSGVDQFKEMSVFYACHIERVDLTGVSEIGQTAFAQCNKLKSISIKNCNAMSAYAVYYCDALEEIRLENVKSIAGQAFLPGTAYNSGENTALKKLTVMGECDSIGGYAFCNFVNRETVVILSKEIKEIASYGFYNCKFDTVYFTGTREEWNAMNIGYADEGYEEYDALNTVAVYCYSETAPSGEGNYWRYASDGVTPVKW